MANFQNLIALAGLVVFLCGQTAPAVAEGVFNRDELRLVRWINYVLVHDQVRDGCLRNPDALENTAELILRQAGISIGAEMLDKWEEFEDKPAPPLA